MTLKDWLHAKDKTQEEFAEKVGVKRATVCHLVNGNKRPSLSLALRIADKTGGDVPVAEWARRGR